MIVPIPDILVSGIQMTEPIIFELFSLSFFIDRDI